MKRLVEKLLDHFDTSGPRPTIEVEVANEDGEVVVVEGTVSEELQEVLEGLEEALAGGVGEEEVGDED